MPAKPISRHFDFGVTFRWIRSESHIAVKRGYVCEGRAYFVKSIPRRYTVVDRPGEDPHNDGHTWIASIPVNADRWHDDLYFAATCHKWALAHPALVDLNNRTRTTN